MVIIFLRSGLLFFIYSLPAVEEQSNHEELEGGVTYVNNSKKRPILLLVNFTKYQKIAQDLSKKRKKSALELSKKVEEELDFLKMAGTKFLVEIIENKVQTT